MTLVTDRTFARACESLERYNHLISDLETTGLDPFNRDVMCGIGLQGYDQTGHDHSDTLYFPFRHYHGDNLDPVQQLPKLIKLIEERVQTGWNYKFDCQYLWNDGMSEEITIEDMMLGAHVRNENELSYELKKLAVRYLGPEADIEDRKLDELLTSNLLGKGDLWRLRPEQVEPYACADVDLTRQMRDFYVPHIAEQDLLGIWQGVNEYSLVVALMEREGLTIDLDLVEQFMAEARQEMFELSIRGRDLAGRKIDLASPSKCAAWLGLSSTAEEVLEVLDDDPRVETLLQFRRYQSAVSRYYKVFLERGIGGVLHPQLRLHGTISGRLACRKPNVQALPRDTKTYRVKRVIVAPPGYRLLQADYSQAEIRLACHYGREERMAAIIRQGINMHRAVSEELKVPYHIAKPINFSVIYGIGAFTLSDTLHIPESRAAKYLAKYHRAYPGFKRLYRECDNFARINKYIRLWSGRMRHYNRGDKITPTHKASSNLIQGGVAELLRERQTRLHKELRPYGFKQNLQVHDSAAMLVPEEIPEKQADSMVREVMEEHERWSLPMTVDITQGPNLEEMR